jgi:diaminopimelate epimerase
MSAPRYVRLAVPVVLASIAVQAGLMAPVASAEPPPPPPSVSLAAESTSVKVSETIHLTATAASDVGPTPYYIRIFNADTHSEVAKCGSGTTCTYSLTVGWEENEHPTAHHFYSEVSGGSEGLYTRSGEVTVNIEPYVFTVSVTATPSSVTIPESYSLKAISNRDVGPTPYYIKIIENGTNSQVAQCGSGTECTTTINSSWSENGEVHLHGYHAVVANSTYTAGTSGTASVAVLPFFFTVSLTLTYDHSEEREGHLVEWDKAVAKTDRDVGPTPYWLAIRKDGSLDTRCGSGTECSAIVEAGHTYTADVENGEGRSFGGSVISSVNVASLAGLFSGASTICTALLTDPYQTHYAGSSVGDQELACEAAIGRGATAAGVISAVAATTGGTAALWWLLHEGTVAQPGFEAPKPTEADPYPAPTTLPEAWPIREVADILEAKNASAELTKEQTEEVARRCLWYMSEAGNDSSECENLPIFLSGSDVPTATRHDLKALASHPQWVRLNYESGTAKEEHGSTREWYKGLGGCAGEKPEGDSCDEYPFFASQQGGPSASPTPSLEYIVATDNSEQGSKYSGFRSACKLSEGAPFLAVPMPPSLGIPTTRLCN